jgi:formate hydrogenlyase subunit 6/NADH:ubiquinone oxidoreductase subunit I
MPKVMIHSTEYADCRQIVDRAFEFFPVSVADTNICIACFCCQEICPEKAIVLR